MGFPIPALSSARMGIQWSLQRLGDAASRIARAGLEVAPSGGPPSAPPAADPTPGGEVDLPDALVDMLIAQRAFSANLRVIETADEMSKEIVNLGRGANRT